MGLSLLFLAREHSPSLVASCGTPVVSVGWPLRAHLRETLSAHDESGSAARVLLRHADTLGLGNVLDHRADGLSFASDAMSALGDDADQLPPRRQGEP